MKKLLIILVAFVGGLLSFSSCEKADLSEYTDKPTDIPGGVTVKFKVSKFEQLPFDEAGTRATAAVKDVCSRISYVFYTSDGTQQKIAHQKTTDSDFGTLSITLPQDSYRLVVIAHNGAGNPTFTSAEKISFPSNKVTDTFYCCEDIEVAEGKEYNLELKRAVAKFRLVIEDAMPTNVSQMKFYYTGGSSTFDAVSGYGCVKSRQTELRDVTADMTGKSTQFEVYSFPHAEEDALKMVVSALDASKNTIKERTFEDVPIQRNVVTQYRGSFFGTSSGGDDDDISIDLIVDDSWTEIDHCY